jgi:class 3 adenylate cyclase
VTIITPQGRRYVETFDVAPDGKFYPISSDTTAAFRLTGDALQATFKGPTGQSDAVRCSLSTDQQVMTCNGVLDEGNGRTANYVDVYDRIKSRSVNERRLR